MSTTLTKKEVSIIAFEAAIKVRNLSAITDEQHDIIFIDGACDITGYSKATIYSFVHKKQIPFHKAAGRRKLFFKKAELLSWMGTDNNAMYKQKEVAP
jgi:excisionase family DNA binding protein